MQRRVIRREEGRLSTEDGTSLFRRSWLTSEPRRVLLLVHGLGEHSGRYDATGSWFATHDAAVHAYDHRGHGRSEGALGAAQALETLIRDVAFVAQRVRKEHPGLPLVVLGHSLGGLLVLRAAAQGLDADAFVTSGAALELTGQWSRWRIAALRALARIAPRVQIDNGVDPETLSRDPTVVQAYRGDAEVRRKVPLAFGAAILASLREGVAFAAAIRRPVLMLHGEADAVCPATGSRNAHAALAGGGHGLRLYPQLRHEILNEPEREQVLRDAQQWIEEREK